MSIRCRCQRCMIRGLMGPVILITIGALFLVGRENWMWGFHRTWPVILLVIGALKLGEALASTDGHGTPPMPGPGAPQGPMQGPPSGTGPIPPPPTAQS
jgi:hypothetical protein